MYGASYILYVAANTCMVRAVLYYTVLRAFSHFHAIYRSFPYLGTIQLEIPTFHSIYAQVQFGILALESTNQPELGSKRPPP